MTALVKVVTPAAVPAVAHAPGSKQITAANTQVTQLRQILTANGNL